MIAPVAFDRMRVKQPGGRIGLQEHAQSAVGTRRIPAAVAFGATPCPKPASRSPKRDWIITRVHQCLQATGRTLSPSYDQSRRSDARHELGHVLMARINGHAIQEVRIWPTCWAEIQNEAHVGQDPVLARKGLLRHVGGMVAELRAEQPQVPTDQWRLDQHQAWHYHSDISKVRDLLQTVRDNGALPGLAGLDLDLIDAWQLLELKGRCLVEPLAEQREALVAQYNDTMQYPYVKQAMAMADELLARIPARSWQALTDALTKQLVLEGPALDSLLARYVPNTLICRLQEQAKAFTEAPLPVAEGVSSAEGSQNGAALAGG